MATEGGRVAVNDVAEDHRLKGVVEEIGGFPAPTDISDPVAVRGMVANVEANLGRIEVLVCNAARMTMAPFLDEPLDQWWEQTT